MGGGGEGAQEKGWSKLGAAVETCGTRQQKVRAGLGQGEGEEKNVSQ